MTFIEMLICITLGYLCLFSLMSRVCTCIEHCATAKGYANLEKAKLLAKGQGKEAHYVESETDQK